MTDHKSPWLFADFSRSMTLFIFQDFQVFQSLTEAWDIGKTPHVRRVLFQGPQSNCILEFPVFSLFDWKCSLCRFTSFVTIKYTKLTWQTYSASEKIQNFLCVWANFQNSLRFSWKGFFAAISPVFPVQWGPCRRRPPVTRTQVRGQRDGLV